MKDGWKFSTSISLGELVPWQASLLLFRDLVKLWPFGSCHCLLPCVSARLGASPTLPPCSNIKAADMICAYLGERSKVWHSPWSFSHFVSDLHKSRIIHMSSLSQFFWLYFSCVIWLILYKEYPRTWAGNRVGSEKKPIRSVFKFCKYFFILVLL